MTTDKPAASSDTPRTCEHDKRFTGVFGLEAEDAGCLACAFERSVRAIAYLRRQMEEQQEFLSEQVSDVLDAKVMQPWMRLSPGLRSYIQSLEHDVENGNKGIKAAIELRERAEQAESSLKAYETAAGELPEIDGLLFCLKALSTLPGWTDPRHVKTIQDGAEKLIQLRSIAARALVEVDNLRAFKRGVDEALNSGDGSYRP